MGRRGRIEVQVVVVAEANSKQCNVGLGRGKIGLKREGKLGQQREKR